MLVNSTIRYALAAAVVGMLLFGISMTVMQFSQDEATLSRARAFSVWSFGFAFAAFAGSLLANQLQ